MCLSCNMLHLFGDRTAVYIYIAYCLYSLLKMIILVVRSCSVLKKILDHTCMFLFDRKCPVMDWPLVQISV